MAFVREFLLKHKNGATAAAVAGLLGIMALLAILSMKDDSITIDEVVHIPAGYAALTQQEYRLNSEKPPLGKDAMALSLLFLGGVRLPVESPAWSEVVDSAADQYDFGYEFFYASGNNVDEILFWARVPMVGVLVLLGLFLFWWAKRVVEPWFALIPVFLLAFSPTFLAYGRLTVTDAGVAFGIIFATYFFLRFLANPQIRTTVLAGAALAFPLLWKHNAIVLLPFFSVLFIVYVWIFGEESERKRFFFRYLKWGAGLAFCTVFLIGVVYQFHIANYAPERQLQDTVGLFEGYNDFYGTDNLSVWFAGLADSVLTRPYFEYLSGLYLTVVRTGSLGIQYFLGNVGISGWWYYFPALYLFKVPLSLHLLTLLVLGIGIHRLSFYFRYATRIREVIRIHFTEFALLFFILFYMSVAIASSLNIGIRHILPVFPPLYLLVAIGVAKWFRDYGVPSLRIKTGVIAALGIWYTFSSLSVFPFYLSYYNELAGGAERGYRVAVNANYDWGQDLKRIGQWATEHQVSTLYVDYFGTGADAQHYIGVERYRPPSGQEGYWGWLEKKPVDLPGGSYIAVSASRRYSGRQEDGDVVRNYVWLDEYSPVDRVGYTTFIYYIE